MAEDIHKFMVPLEIEAEVKILMDQVQEAASQNDKIRKEDITLQKPVGLEFSGGEEMAGVLIVSTTLLAWMTKAWFDKYVAPVLLARVHGPSKAFTSWLERLFGVAQTKADAAPSPAGQSKAQA